MRKLLKLGIVIAVSVILLLFMLLPEVYLASSLNGIKLWAVIVLPCILPFFFFTSLLTSLNIPQRLSKIFEGICQKLFKCPGISAYVFLMSVLSGYPVGAKIVQDLYEAKAITSDEATRISTFCSTSGPIFIVGSVGTCMFYSKTIGFIMLTSHILSAVICGVIFRNYGKVNANKNYNHLSKPSQNLLYDSVYSSVISVLCVGGFICIFYIIADMVSNFNCLSFIYKPISSITSNQNLIKAFFEGLIETTRGVLYLSKFNSNIATSLAVALISFGGISILAQSIMFLYKCKVNLKIFLLSKVLQSIFSFAICFAVLCFI